MTEETKAVEAVETTDATQETVDLNLDLTGLKLE